MKIDPPVLITGCARSGTSMTAALYHMSGFWGGEVEGATKFNPKGFFENGMIRQVIVKPYLRSIGADPLGQDPLPDVTKLRTFAALRMHIEEVLRVQGYRNGKWYYKGAKMCLIWPIFADAFPKAKWIIVRRKDEDIINSCLKTGFMRKRSTAEEWQEWIDHHKMCFKMMQGAGLQVKEVWPSKFVEGDFTEIQEAIKWCGGQLNEDEARRFISPDLYTRSK